MNCLWLNPIALPFALMLMALYRLFQGSPDTESPVAYALALVFMALIVRVLLLPFQMRSKKGMLRQTRLQPKIAELQKRHGANKQKLNEEMAQLYRDEGINPASGCLWSFIQMPIMIALFYAIRQPISLMMRLESDLWLEGRSGFNPDGRIYNTLSKILSPEQFETLFNTGDFYAELKIANAISENWNSFKDLGIEGLHRVSFYLGNINLADVPNFRVWEFDWSGGTWLPSLLLFFLPLLSGGAQFVSAAIMRKTTPQANPEANQGGAGAIMKFMPLMSVWFGFILPGALSLYWTIGTCLQIAQDLWLNKKYTKMLDEEDMVKDAARREKEAELEAKRLETERQKELGLVSGPRNVSKRKRQAAEKHERRKKAAEYEKRVSPSDSPRRDTDAEPGRVGNRKYARGRAYDPDRYGGGSSDTDSDDESNGYSTDNDDNNVDDVSGDTGDVIEVSGEVVEDN